MERVMSPEERIRRAEEIYYRRKAQGIRVSTASVNVGSSTKVSLGKKMIIQIIVCVIIYSFFAIIKNNETNFSKTTIQQVNGILNYDINLADIYNQCSTYVINTYNNMINSSKKQKEEQQQDIQNSEQNVDNVVENSPEIPSENPSEDNEVVEGIELNVDENIELQNNEQIENQPTDNQVQEEIPQESKSQMQLDAEYVIANYSLIVPVNGYITSGFGDREPTEIISSFHQGIDIAAVTRNTNKSSHGRNRGCFFICRRLSETT